MWTPTASTHIASSNPEHKCDLCEHFEGWVGVDVGGQICFDVHGACTHAGRARTIANPLKGCSLWEPEDPDNIPKPPIYYTDLSTETGGN